MRAHLAAFKAALEADGLRVFIADAGASPTYPYVVLAASSGLPGAERAVEAGSEFEDIVYVTAAGVTADSVYIIQGKARAALAAFQGSTAVAGRVVWLTQFDSRTVRPDRDVTVTQTSAHPLYGVDLYRLVSVPA